MNPYTKVDVSEQQLEDLVRRYADKIETGLLYVDHQKWGAGGRLDVLMVDSGKSLVVAELKIVEDDGMLMQGMDYYDYVSTHIEAFARLYKDYGIDPTQQVRLFLIAPSFSQTIVNRCKWMDMPISLFTFQCLKLGGDTDTVPIFVEQPLPKPSVVLKVANKEDHVTYITDIEVRAQVIKLLEEIENWMPPGRILLDSTKYSISMKVNGRVFAYFYARRKHYILATYNDQGEWKEYSIKTDDDLAKAKPIMKAAMERWTK